jgi:hypothetical protein
MESNLRVVAEREITDAELAQGVPGRTEGQSETLSRPSPSSAAEVPRQSLQTIELLMEIRKVLNARAGALIAMVGAFLLTVGAMVLNTPMSLAIAISYDVLVFLPIAVIAYRGSQKS